MCARARGVARRARLVEHALVELVPAELAVVVGVDAAQDGGDLFGRLPLERRELVRREHGALLEALGHGAERHEERVQLGARDQPAAVGVHQKEEQLQLGLGVAWRVRRGEIGEFGGAWLQGHGHSLGDLR